MSSSFVVVNVSNSQNDTVSFERKFPKNITIIELKYKLEVITGGSAGTMQIELFDGDQLVKILNDNNSILGSFDIKDGMRLHVVDNILFDQNVPKFELTQDQYDKRSDSLKSFLTRNKLGKYNEEEMKKLENEKVKQSEKEARTINAAEVGVRCKVSSKGKPTRFGTVMYNGPLEGKKGIFIGVKFDEPLGNNDGSIDGKRYFECCNKYGSFVSPNFIEIGDFPPEEFNIDDEL
ncbi:tubulin-folding cofactor B [Culicoides brevitarsis]|uniref:tubulin-folding cofactor B n=1 Tax=Culicoides brevitarsis TaxID=469753 RepID=UPI00307C01B4